jgi:predicted RNase H-like HicB family nuclease
MKKRMIKIAHLVLTTEQNNGRFPARCPTIEGAFAEGDTVAETILKCVDVVRMIREYAATGGGALPRDARVS